MNEKELEISKLDPLFQLKKSITTLIVSLAHHKCVVRGAVENTMGQLKLVVYIDPDSYKLVELLHIPTKHDGYDVVVRKEVPNGGNEAIYKDHYKYDIGKINK